MKQVGLQGGGGGVVRHTCGQSLGGRQGHGSPLLTLAASPRHLAEVQMLIQRGWVGLRLCISNELWGGTAAADVACPLCSTV